ncbi:E2 ubiquitin-conjugating enzyme [Plasmodiophora brassicae]|uniref:E2 ubiquitin-conjugating enzyme n=1 Tax=Plasmodiophora brassicae TaxID=37360 RepID=A0A0G4J3T6_PLABS|nr:hypothetical protein PBRA_002417 [Plasmodiophora brassicae]SPQ93657.1 unnamed protein product [Plasmodiophora brassicae]
MAPSAACLRRLKKEYKKILDDPVPNIEAVPLDSNILEWHYVVTGPPDSPYEGGVYHGKIKFPSEYPYKPPSIFMITPSGRFQPNTRLCLSMSDFHPEEWSCLWSVSSILSGLLSFMTDTAPTFGSVNTTTETKRHLAAISLETNLKNPVFVKLFPHYKEVYRARQEAAAQNNDSNNESERPADLSPNKRTSWTTAEVTDRLVIVVIIAVVALAVSYMY